MDLEGKKVTHKLFGEGTVTAFDGAHVEVGFGCGVKKFSYPDAFERFLTLKDAEAGAEIETLLTEKEKAKEERLRSLTEELLPRKEAEKAPAGKKGSFTKTARNDRMNVILKCNYCDGGATEECPGYCGICSDDVIDYNINTAQKITCSQEDCPCRRYNAGELSREELDALLDDNAVICPESRLLRDWTVDTGMMIADRESDRTALVENAAPGGLCILTARDPEESESGRYIFAVFLMDDVEADENGAGTKIFPAPGYRIMLSDEEAHKMQLWKYNNADNEGSGITLWNAGLFRYASDKTALSVLEDVRDLKKGTPAEEDAERFLETFRKLVK